MEVDRGQRAVARRAELIGLDARRAVARVQILFGSALQVLDWPTKLLSGIGGEDARAVRAKLAAEAAAHELRDDLHLVLHAVRAALAICLRAPKISWVEDQTVSVRPSQLATPPCVSSAVMQRCGRLETALNASPRPARALLDVAALIGAGVIV